MRPPANELTVPPSPWRATGAPPLSLPASDAPVSLAAPTAATVSSPAVAAVPPQCPAPAQQLVSPCCVVLGLIVIAIVLMLAWMIHRESKSWKDY